MSISEDLMVLQITRELQQAARVAARAESVIGAWDLLVREIDNEVVERLAPLLSPIGGAVSSLRRELGL